LTCWWLFVSLACLADGAIAQDGPMPVCPPSTAFLYGPDDWYDFGDVIQFMGDANRTVMGDGGCAEHWWVYGHCVLDTGLFFREVSDFDAGSCSYTPSSTCDVFKVPCCFFWGYEPVCGECEGGCVGCDLCMSFWEISDFHADGVTGRGCWELTYLADCTEDDCWPFGLYGCSTVRI
jgi:hypothetical protein